MHRIIPAAIKALPLDFVFNQIFRKIWLNLGAGNMRLSIDGNNIHITAEKEILTRCAGRNRAMVGFNIGVISAVTGQCVKVKKVVMSKNKTDYFFELERRAVHLPQSRSLAEYNSLNKLTPVKGFTLKDALEKKVFTLRGNEIFFRGKRISIIENSFFGLLGKEKILLERVPLISHDYFKALVIEETSKEAKLILLKTLLQTMGWGIIDLILKEDGITLIIRNPPHSFSLHDNWDFLMRVVLGYLWLIDKRFRLSNSRYESNRLIVEFTSSKALRKDR
jgi:hypothetical protein